MITSVTKWHARMDVDECHVFSLPVYNPTSNLLRCSPFCYCKVIAVIKSADVNRTCLFNTRLMSTIKASSEVDRRETQSVYLQSGVPRLKCYSIMLSSGSIQRNSWLCWSGPKHLDYADNHLHLEQKSFSVVVEFINLEVLAVRLQINGPKTNILSVDLSTLKRRLFTLVLSRT